MQRFLTIRIAATLAAVLLLAPAAAAEPDTETILKELGFPADTPTKVRAGEMVKIDLAPSNAREIGVGLAFLVKETPKQLAAQITGGLLLVLDKNSEAHGIITGEGSLDQFAGLKLGSLEDTYREAEPGDDLNLSSAEIQAFQALKGKPAAAVEQQVREFLLERYQAYHAKGLDGIAPYDRGKRQFDPGADLKSATEAASVVKTIAPAYYGMLLDYPKKPSSGVEEIFNWQRYKARGEPVYILTHGFTVEGGEAVAAAQRQFYVSGGYNVEQAMAGFLPVSEGTLVVYLNRTSTDQVTGFGSGAKRSVGERVLSSQLEDLYKKVQKAGDK